MWNSKAQHWKLAEIWCCEHFGGVKLAQTTIKYWNGQFSGSYSFQSFLFWWPPDIITNKLHVKQQGTAFLKPLEIWCCKHFGGVKLVHTTIKYWHGQFYGFFWKYHPTWDKVWYNNGKGITSGAFWHTFYGCTTSGSCPSKVPKYALSDDFVKRSHFFETKIRS